ncbi:MAG: hypothetical protein Q7K16_01020 [Candidatus Azambacteria bacterium]|nr:hypothetical protein [Candidatus Azambacteria bacterium]
MNSQTPPETLEVIVSSFAVILDEVTDPPWIFLFHVNGEEHKETGEITQPAGWKLPGGSYEKPRDRTPRHTARNETKLEIGINTRLRKFFPDSQYGEALQENKIFLDKDKTLPLQVYTFFMKRIGKETDKRVETNEGGASGSFSLTDVLLMPLSRDTKNGKLNPYGIHFSARKRIFTTLKRAGHNFLELIPNLPELIGRIDWEDVGEEVYWILRDAIDAPPESEILSEILSEEKETALGYSESDHEKICPCDACWQRWWTNELIST